MQRVPLRIVAREWGRIGVLGFGGPPAHIALLRDLTVGRWLDREEFEDAYAACSLLPGPASTQMAIYTAQRVAGRAGAVIGGLAFILPGLVAALVIATVAFGDRPPEGVRGFGAGAAAAVVAVVAQAGVRLISIKSFRAPVYVAAGVAGAALAGPAVVAVLLVCGAAELAWRSRTAASAAWPALLWLAFKVGALSYGGGFVIIPLMQHDALRWMSAAQFANAVAYGQITPGPVTHTVALVGYAATGLPGALAATVVAFAPSFVLVMLGAPHFARMRTGPARTFLDGAGPAAAGAILGAAIPLVRALDHGWQYAVLAAAALALLRVGPIYVLVAGGLAGLATTL